MKESFLDASYRIVLPSHLRGLMLAVQHKASFLKTNNIGVIVRMMRKHKYEGLEHFAQELFRKRICNLVRIPVKTIEPYLKGSKSIRGMLSGGCLMDT